MCQIWIWLGLSTILSISCHHNNIITVTNSCLYASVFPSRLWLYFWKRVKSWTKGRVKKNVLNHWKKGIPVKKHVSHYLHLCEWLNVAKRKTETVFSRRWITSMKKKTNGKNRKNCIEHLVLFPSINPIGRFPCEFFAIHSHDCFSIAVGRLVRI